MINWTETLVWLVFISDVLIWKWHCCGMILLFFSLSGASLIEFSLVSYIFNSNEMKFQKATATVCQHWIKTLRLLNYYYFSMELQHLRNKTLAWFTSFQVKQYKIQLNIYWNPMLCLWHNLAWAAAAAIIFI